MIKLVKDLEVGEYILSFEVRPDFNLYRGHVRFVSVNGIETVVAYQEGGHVIVPSASKVEVQE